MLITNYFDWRADFDTLLRYSGAFPLSFSETRLQTSCLLMDMRPKKKHDLKDWKAKTCVYFQSEETMLYFM